MEFQDNKAIYLQIADMICEKVLGKQWEDGDRIPSVREMASNFQVNPNTIMRTFGHLQQAEIIQNKRGIGYFLTETSHKRTLALKRSQFLETQLPQLVNTLNLLGYNNDDLNQLIKQYQNENK